MNRPIVWTVAGTDPSGGAGIQADLKVFHALGAYGGSAITAVIAQNTLDVRAVEFPSEAMVEAQLEALREDLPPVAVKLGMLGRAATVRAVARVLREFPAAFVVCDPVLGSTGGVPLLDAEGLAALRDELLPRVDVLTPNRPEAARLTGRPVEDEEGMRRAADALRAMGARGVVVKGGHGTGAEARDLFVDAAHRQWLTSPRLAAGATHGTGCTFSSALAAFVALGRPVAEAVARAKAYVNQGLRLGGGIGRGNGPLAHEGWPRSAQDRPEVSDDTGY